MPDVYRNAMVAVLAPTPVTTEQPKPKPHHSSRGIAAPPTGGSPSLSSSATAAPNEIQISTGLSQAVGEGNQAVPAVSQALTETRTKRTRE